MMDLLYTFPNNEVRNELSKIGAEIEDASDYNSEEDEDSETEEEDENYGLFSVIYEGCEFLNNGNYSGAIEKFKTFLT